MHTLPDTEKHVQDQVPIVVSKVDKSLVLFRLIFLFELGKGLVGVFVIVFRDVAVAALLG